MKNCLLCYLETFEDCLKNKDFVGIEEQVYKDLVPVIHKILTSENCEKALKKAISQCDYSALGRLESQILYECLNVDYYAKLLA